jgi:CRISPR-associated protein Csm3
MMTFAKVAITATLTVETGMHIGTGGAFSAIGAVDSPVVRDPLSKLPMVPGSSLKGKMRSLLAKEYNNEEVAKDANGDAERIKRLFGSSDPVKVARLVFRDSVLANEDSLRKRGATQVTEIKYENTIDRKTAVAIPRQIERAIRGSEFDFELMYEVPAAAANAEIKEDIETLATGLKLLTYDYLGGHGTRGYGQVSFKDAKATVAVGSLDDSLLAYLNNQLSELRSE